ncbi:unnamed protein product [Gordionus sp. m RMFG-2023]
MNYTFAIPNDVNYSSPNLTEEVAPNHETLSSRYVFSIFICVITALGILGNSLIIFGLFPGTKTSYRRTLKLLYDAHSRYYLILISAVNIIVCINAAFRASWILKYPINCFSSEMGFMEAVLVLKFREFIICNCLFLSHWLMAILSLRALAAIKYPIFYRINFMDKKSNLDGGIILVLMMVSFVTCFPFLLDKSIQNVQNEHIPNHKYYVQENDKLKPFLEVYYRAEMIVSVTVPCALIMISNLLTWYLMYKKDRSNTRHRNIPSRRRCFSKVLMRFKITCMKCRILPNATSSDNLQMRITKASKARHFAVVAGILTTITFIFSLPITVLVFLKGVHRIFDINCFSLSYMLAYIFLILKYFIFPYLILFGNPALQNLILKTKMSRFLKVLNLTKPNKIQVESVNNLQAQ